MNKFFAQSSMAILSLSLLLFSCSDDNLNVGLEILPNSDLLEIYADTLAIECFTYKGSSGTFTFNPAQSYPIGHVLDNVFGETTSDIIMELVYDGDTYYGHDSVNSTDIVKSLKLYLNTTNLDVYGETDALKIDAFLLNSRHTYTGNTLQALPYDLFEGNNSLSTQTTHNDNIDVDTIPYLSPDESYTIIELDNSLATALMDSSIYTSTEFYNVLPGFLLRAKDTTETGALQNFIPANSKLVLEYEREGTKLYSTYSFQNIQCTFRNNHTDRGAEIENSFRDTVNQAKKFYLQGLGGTRGIIKLKSLIDFKTQYSGRIGVNLAEIVLPINQDNLDDTTMFPLPKRISAQGITPNYLVALPDDNQYLSAYYFNGYLDIDNLEYRINISEYVNRYLLNDVDYLLLNITMATYNGVVPTTMDYISPARVVLNSGLEELAERAFLRIIYTVTDN
jgi:cyclophilin family peptidyl-prolyl cis-trans isomerase